MSPHTDIALEQMTREQLIDVVQSRERRVDELWNECADLRERAEAAEFNFGVEHGALVEAEAEVARLTWMLDTTISEWVVNDWNPKPSPYHAHKDAATDFKAHLAARHEERET